MDDPEISLRQYIERIIDERERAHEQVRAAEGKALDVARQELDHWKVAHNNWQAQMHDMARDFVRLKDHDFLAQQISRVERLVYVGVGLAMAIEIAIAFIRKGV